MCVFVSQRGAFPHTWAICHILGKHSVSEAALGGGLGRQDSGDLPRLASPHPPPLAGGCWWQHTPGGPVLLGGSGPTALGTRGVPLPCWCGVTPLRWGAAQGGQCWGWGSGGGSALCTVLGVTALALPFEPESPNIGALCCSFTAVTMLPGGSCPGGAGSHLLLPWGKH